MQFTLVLATFAAVVYGQINGVPSCAIPCIQSAITSKTTCAATDFACACPKISDVAAAGSACVVSACGQEAATQAFAAVQAFCDAQ